MCDRLGGTDVTDEGVARITPGMIEFYQCDLPTKKDGGSRLNQEPDSSKNDNSNEQALTAGSAVITQIDGTGSLTATPAPQLFKLLLTKFRISRAAQLFDMQFSQTLATIQVNNFTLARQAQHDTPGVGVALF